ncbi:MAG: formate dehydrogenase accessory protein FdhE [Candidatus Heimdallarchaeota archaeon]|nr:formate dehydrogenase accessory protein FdhE [Candidatus Heimdallarchaeota archaeon]
MGKTSIQKQLETVSTMLEKHKDLQSPLELKKRTLLVQLEIDSTPTKGLSIDLGDKGAINDLQQKALDKKLPIIYFLDPSKNDLEFLMIAFKKLVQVFVEQNISNESLKKLLSNLETGKISLSKLIEASLRENISIIEEAAKETDVKAEILLYMVSALIQPCLEEIARKIDSQFHDKWWQGSCPVCGRISAVAKNRGKKRFLVCTYCGTEYLFDNFFCVHCGNKDPYTLKFIEVEAKPAFKIDFCTKCNHYIKVLEETKMKDPIPKGLEDILTLNLDLVAKDAGLVRN